MWREIVWRACVADVFAVFAESAPTLGAESGDPRQASALIARDALKVWQQEPRQQQRQQQLQLQPERLAERQSAAERPRRAAAA